MLVTPIREELVALRAGLYAMCGPLNDDHQPTDGNLARLLQMRLPAALQRLFAKPQQWHPLMIALKQGGGG